MVRTGRDDEEGMWKKQQAVLEKSERERERARSTSESVPEKIPKLPRFAQLDGVRGSTHSTYTRLTCTGARENIHQDQHGALRYAAADLRSSMSGSDTLSEQAVGLGGVEEGRCLHGDKGNLEDKGQKEDRLTRLTIDSTRLDNFILRDLI